jgi:uncharacterized protein DUF6980
MTIKDDWFEQYKKEEAEYLKKIDEKVEEERRNYAGPHCCLTMDRGLQSERKILQYDKKYREYSINLSRSKGGFLFDYCPFCGKKLPESLRKLWFNILEQEYHLEFPLSLDKKKVPAEFQTDEWWKKRGL